MDRRSLITAMPLALIACSAGAGESRASESASLPPISVYKTPTCGCCNAWVDHLRAADFTVETIDVPDTTPIAGRLGVPDALRSCHTAEIDGYAIEGHVPAADIRRLLVERPDAAGLAVPGMPLGSPGMEMGDRRENYDVILFSRSGGTQIFTSR
ncbi:MAG: DUF411 domain-containing protein [Sphingomonadaceae bacterium]|nr:DUF411 domain-containing protein [Sphingomonadaceae bacterium]